MVYVEEARGDLNRRKVRRSRARFLLAEPVKGRRKIFYSSEQRGIFFSKEGDLLPGKSTKKPGGCLFLGRIITCGKMSVQQRSLRLCRKDV